MGGAGVPFPTWLVSVFITAASIRFGPLTSYGLYLNRVPITSFGEQIGRPSMNSSSDPSCMILSPMTPAFSAAQTWLLLSA